ncbi:pyruvate formate-lyase-activating protein [Krasilnikovia sp. MM14-A1259]|uniref:pyruvate formate-lyase-activating protein n=1 Tax=Krasilnikovia sp. MM14-A1259 TaxID=3373539 RepID=UPI00381E39A4
MTPALKQIVGAVHSYDVSVGVDGPGTRFVAFLAGCPLRCLYCHSPDTWFRRSGTATTVDELMTKVHRYERFVKMARGGVTLSGGDPLQQPDFVRAVFAACRDLDLHTALDTSGFLGDRADDDLLDVTSLVLLDVKSGDEQTYKAVTKTGRLAPTVRFAHRLAERGTPIWVRFVLVPGLTDAVDNVAAIADIVAGVSTVERVEVLPFHTLGAPKYAALGLDYPLKDTPGPSPELLDRVHGQFRERGLTVT